MKNHYNTPMEQISLMLSSRFAEALTLAFELHGQDTRKSTSIPVLAHLLAVSSLVLYDGGDEDEAIAALLHDALEDKPHLITREDLKSRFGTRVLSIVETSTDTPVDYVGGEKPPWRERKEAYLNHARHADPGLLRVTVADKVDNLRAMLADYCQVGDELWTRFNAGQADQVWYYSEAAKAYEKAGFSSPLLEQLKRLVKQLCALPEGK
jgi:(p)ppGpp synthase/HD superfamily hydrolase